ncbi:hypothetical protein NYO67_11551 [Aspergillus flavus]|nr:hypothetical protein NYO67_11551 [Aspergillus flavus]
MGFDHTSNQFESHSLGLLRWRGRSAGSGVEVSLDGQQHVPSAIGPMAKSLSSLTVVTKLVIAIHAHDAEGIIVRVNLHRLLNTVNCLQSIVMPPVASKRFKKVSLSVFTYTQIKHDGAILGIIAGMPDKARVRPDIHGVKPRYKGLHKGRSRKSTHETYYVDGGDIDCAFATLVFRPVVEVAICASIISV